MRYQFSPSRFTKSTIAGTVIGLVLAAVVYPYAARGGEPSAAGMLFQLFAVMVRIYGWIPLRLFTPAMTVSFETVSALILINWALLGAFFGLIGGFFPATDDEPGSVPFRVRLHTCAMAAVLFALGAYVVNPLHGKHLGIWLLAIVTLGITGVLVLLRISWSRYLVYLLMTSYVGTWLWYSAWRNSSALPRSAMSGCSLC